MNSASQFFLMLYNEYSIEQLRDTIKHLKLKLYELKEIKSIATIDGEISLIVNILACINACEIRLRSANTILSLKSHNKTSDSFIRK